MRPATWSALAPALLSAALGCGADDTSAATGAQAGPSGGTGGGADGCVDIVVGPHLMDEPGEWRPWSHSVRGAVWQTQDAIHVAWAWDKKTDAITIGEPGEEHHTFVVVSSFDPATGGAIGHRILDLFPAHVGASKTGLPAGTGTPDGVFAIKASWGFGQSGEDLFIIGRPDGSVLVVDVSLGFITSQIAWDGEAFAVHGNGDISGGVSLQLARIGLDGAMVMPPAEIGKTVSVGYQEVGFEVSTRPSHGTTFVFDASSAHTILNAHARDGTPLWQEAKHIEANGFPFDEGHLPVAVFTGEDDAWVVFSQGGLVPTTDPDFVGYQTLVQRLDLYGNPVGPGVEIAGAPDDVKPLLSFAFSVVGREGGGAWVGAGSGYRIYLFEHDGENMAPPRIVVNADGLDENPQFFDAMAFERDGVPWLAFQETPPGKVACANSVCGAGPLVHRVVRAKEGCEYPALAKQTSP